MMFVFGIQMTLQANYNFFGDQMALFIIVICYNLCWAIEVGVIFLLVVWHRSLDWTFSSETVTTMASIFALGYVAASRTTFPTFYAFVSLALYPAARAYIAPSDEVAAAAAGGSLAGRKSLASQGTRSPVPRVGPWQALQIAITLRVSPH